MVRRGVAPALPRRTRAAPHRAAGAVPPGRAAMSGGEISSAGASSAASPPACGAEALALLNCVASEAYGERGEGCAAAMAALRKCTRQRKVTDFTLGGGATGDEKARPPAPPMKGS